MFSSDCPIARGMWFLKEGGEEVHRILPGVEDVKYQERLNNLGLFPLEHWRLKCIDRVDRQNTFPMV